MYVPESHMTKSMATSTDKTVRLAKEFGLSVEIHTSEVSLINTVFTKSH